MRELAAMAESRARFEWGIASSMMALLANINRDRRKSDPFSPSDFNPFAPKPPKPVLCGEEMKEALKAAFCRKTKKKA